jgi:hypothetical protein
MLQRGLTSLAAAIMICAIGAALIQLAMMIFGLSLPVAVTVLSLAAVGGLNWLRRNRRAPAAAVRGRRGRGRD